MSNSFTSQFITSVENKAFYAGEMKFSCQYCKALTSESRIAFN